MEILIVKNTYWAVFYAMEYNPDFLLKFLIYEIKLQKLRQVTLGGHF
jgi:hypothetical protein